MVSDDREDKAEIKEMIHADIQDGGLSLQLALGVCLESKGQSGCAIPDLIARAYAYILGQRTKALHVCENHCEEDPERKARIARRRPELKALIEGAISELDLYEKLLSMLIGQDDIDPRHSRRTMDFVIQEFPDFVLDGLADDPECGSGGWHSIR